MAEGVRGPLIERHVSPAWLRVGLKEASNIDEIYDEMRQAGPIPDVPLIVLTARGSMPSSGRCCGRVRGTATPGERGQATPL